MPVPNLIHPLSVTLEKSDKANTFFDDDSREPVRHVARTSYTVKAQRSYSRAANPAYTAAGVNETVLGYILARKTDLDALSLTLQLGDKITAIGHRATSLFVAQVEDVAHYSDTSGSTLVRAYFNDRRTEHTTPTVVSTPTGLGGLY